MTEKMEVQHVVNNDAAVKAIQELVNQVKKLESGSERMSQTSKRGTDAVKGSFAALERELKDNVRVLKDLKVGTAEYAAQKSKVDGLRKKHAAVKKEIMGSRDQMRQVGSATDGVVGKVLKLATGVGTVTAGLRVMKEAFDAFHAANEGKRLETITLEEGLLEGGANFANKRDRRRLRESALGFAEQGLAPGGTAVALGELKSKGAPTLEAAEDFLRVAANQKPGDLPAALGLAGAALVEARGTGNWNAEEIIGGIRSAQIASQSSNSEQFARAFSANTVALTQSGGFTPEQAREEAVKFSILEPRSEEVAATSQRAFISQLREFTPEAKGGVTKDDVDRYLSASVYTRIGLLMNSQAMRDQFIPGLRETGRDAIVRRIAPGEADQQTFAGVERDVVSGKAAVAQLRELQKEAQDTAPLMIENVRAETQETVNRIRSADLAKFEDAVLKRSDEAHLAARDDTVSDAAFDYMTRRTPLLYDTIGLDPQTMLASVMSGQSMMNTRLFQMAMLARSDPQREDRELTRSKLEELKALAESLGLKEQQMLLEKILVELQEQNGKRRGQAFGDAPPEEQPVPIAALNRQ